MGQQYDTNLRVLPVLGSDDVVDVDIFVCLSPAVDEVLGSSDVVAALLQLLDEQIAALDLRFRAGHARAESDLLYEVVPSNIGVEFPLR